MVDASVTLAWLLGEGNEYADAAMDRLPHTRAAAPSLWRAEVANGLLMAERRRRISVEKTAQLVQLLEQLSVQVSDERRTVNELIVVARQARLTIYDATYLDLARRLNLPLATLDRQLADAAAAAGVTLFAADS